MTTTTIPRGPWHNPQISEGVHDAEIVEIRQGRYGTNRDMYLQIVLRLPKQQEYMVTNLYFPSGQPNSKTVQRLSRLCSIVGLAPQDALDSPKDFAGAQIKVATKEYANDNRKYQDVQFFLPPDAECAVSEWAGEGPHQSAKELHDE